MFKLIVYYKYREKFLILSPNVKFMQIPDIIIAIDGYSSTGKSSFAKLIAKKLGYVYLDSGALYRGVTLYAMENGWISDDCSIDEAALLKGLENLNLHFGISDKGNATYIGSRCVEQQIRSLAVAAKVSPVSAVPAVRNFVDTLLKKFGAAKRVVMDGRDIGTTVFPEAELKIFMTADTDIRAERRAAEMRAKGQDVDIEEVKKNLLERDYIDSHREVSPLTQAPDAVVLDNSHMTFDQQMDWFMELLRKRFA